MEYLEKSLQFLESLPWNIIIKAAIVFSIIPTIFCLWFLARSWSKRRNTWKTSPDLRSYGFFHPSCSGGGGGERVLWTALDNMIKIWPNCKIIIYAKRDTSANILARVKSQFGFDIPGNRIQFVWLDSSMFLEAKMYPRFTLVGQSLGAMIPVTEALLKFVPDVFVETVGFAWANPVARLFGCVVISYVHYPTISTDMLKKVSERKADFNNSSTIASSSFLSKAKLWYYKAFAMAYGLMGRLADAVMVNSTWTCNHITSIWGVKPTIVYPPTDTSALQQFPLEGRQRIIASVAQFRPEKNQAMGVKILAEVLKKHSNVKLVFLGGVRNDADEALLNNLKNLAKELQVDHAVEFLVNAPYQDLQDLLRTSLIGLHTMKDEHFGISIVEYMAAGLIAVVHDSGGPKSDIIEDGKTGFRASTVSSYAKAIDTILEMSQANQLAIQTSARREATTRFTSKDFCEAWLNTLQQPE